jgi:hypothetical protein
VVLISPDQAPPSGRAHPARPRRSGPRGVAAAPGPAGRCQVWPDLRGELAERDEDLAAARAANRDLMAQLNR